MRRPPSLLVASLFLCSIQFANADERKLTPILPGGHSMPVAQATLSHDGKRLLTAAYDNTLMLWDTATGDRLHSFPRYTTYYRFAPGTLSGDGKLVATVGETLGGIQLWDADTGQKLRTFERKANRPIRSLSLSASGSLLLVHEESHGTLALLETLEGKEVESFQEGTSTFSSAAFSPDSKYVIATLRGSLRIGGRPTGPEPLSTILWEVATGKKVKVLKGYHTLQPECVAIAADGKHIVTGSADTTAFLWGLKDEEPIQLFRGHTGHISSVAISTDGQQIVTGADDRTAILWDLDRGKPRQTFQGHTGPVTCVALSADGKVLATGSQDRTVRLWDPTTGKQRLVLQQEPVTRMALSQDGSKLAALESTTALLWDLSQGKLAHTFQGPLKDVYLPGKPRPIVEKQPCTLTCMSMSGKDAWLAVGTETGEILIWEAATGKQLHKFRGSRNLTGVDVSADHEWFVYAAGTTVHAKQVQSGSNRIYESPKIERIVGGNTPNRHDPAQPFTGVAISADGRIIAATTQGLGLMVWTPTPGQGLWATPRESSTSTPGALALSADGKRVLGVMSEGSLMLRDLAGKKIQRFQIGRGGVHAAALAADGKRAAAAYGDRSVLLWDTDTAQQLQTFVGHTQAVNGVALSPDGQRLWSSSADGTMRLWDTATGKELGALMSFDSGKEWLVVTPDGACDGSAGGLQRLVWRDERGQRVADDVTRQRLQRPGLLATLLKGERPRE